MEKDEAGTAGIKVMDHDLQKEGCLFKVVMVQNQGKEKWNELGGLCPSNCSKILIQHPLCIRHIIDNGHTMEKADLVLELKRVVWVEI